MIVVLIGALVIGVTLGLLGSGGSALTVPVLVYLVGHHAKQSIAESMVIVGLISMAAAIPYAKAKQIDWRSVWYFGIPGMAGTIVGAWLGGIASDGLQLIVFGSVLVAAAMMMMRKPQAIAEFDESPAGRHRPSGIIAAEGVLVGITTGFVGVGGGFLIVPALVVFGKLPMRLAIGTSLVIIALKAAVGFAKYQQYLMAHGMSVDGQTVLIFVLVGVAGSLLGRSLNAGMNQRLLKRVFVVVLMLLGSLVIVNEATNLAAPATDQPAADANVLKSAPPPPPPPPPPAGGEHVRVPLTRR